MKNFLNSEKEFRFNEILFENRNKNYGAYVMRNEESKNLTKALFVGVAFFGALAITPLIINSFQSPVIITEGPGGTIFTPQDIPDFIPPVVNPVTPPRAVENTVKLEIPTPTRNSTNEKPPKSITEIEKANIGTDNVVGTAPTTLNPPVIVQNIDAVPIVPVPKPVNNNPVTNVDIEASFSGGINAFRSKVVQNFSAGDFEGTGDLLKTTVTFIVEKDGSISSITAAGKDARFNKEAEKTIKNIRGKWAPAKLNGENVRSYFKFPIAMQFE